MLSVGKNEYRLPIDLLARLSIVGDSCYRYSWRSLYHAPWIDRSYPLARASSGLAEVHEQLFGSSKLRF